MKKILMGLVAALFATSAWAQTYTSDHKGDWSVSSNEELTEVISENRAISYKKGLNSQSGPTFQLAMRLVAQNCGVDDWDQHWQFKDLTEILKNNGCN